MMEIEDQGTLEGIKLGESRDSQTWEVVNQGKSRPHSHMIECHVIASGQDTWKNHKVAKGIWEAREEGKLGFRY